MKDRITAPGAQTPKNGDIKPAELTNGAELAVRQGRPLRSAPEISGDDAEVGIVLMELAAGIVRNVLKADSIIGVSLAALHCPHDRVDVRFQQRASIRRPSGEADVLIESVLHSGGASCRPEVLE